MQCTNKFFEVKKVLPGTEILFASASTSISILAFANDITRETRERGEKE